MRLIFKTEMLIYHAKANLDEKILFGRIIHLQNPQIGKMLVRGLYGNREFHVPFWSMIYLAWKFEFTTIVSFRNRILISIASKSRTRMEGGILDSHTNPLQAFF